MRSRNTFIQFAILAAVMLLISSCASLSPNGVGRVKRYTFAEESVPEEFDGWKFAFVSDLHYPSLFTPKRLGKLVRRLQKESPDALLLGGDYVTDNDSIDALFKSLSAVKTSLGTYAVLGNHDKCNEPMIRKAMGENGVMLLDGTIQYMIFDDGGELGIAGVYDSFADDTLFAQYMERANDPDFLILLTHKPDFVERHSLTADLAFAGHTHGGQITIPLLGSVINPHFGRKLNYGWKKSGNKTMFVSCGINSAYQTARLGMKPEIVVITLQSAGKN